MGGKKKTASYEYENEGHKAVGSIGSKKANQDKSFKEYARKRAKRKGITLPEKENEENVE